MGGWPTVVRESLFAEGRREWNIVRSESRRWYGSLFRDHGIYLSILAPVREVEWQVRARYHPLCGFDNNFFAQDG